MAEYLIQEETLTAEYLIQEETLTGLAGSLRTLNGSTASMDATQMKPIVDEANTELESQASVIAQIKSALSGKALTEGDGAIIEEIQTELDRRNFVAYETCTVTVNDNTWWGTQSHINCYYLGLDQYGNIKNLGSYGASNEGEFSQSFTALKGSRIFLEHSGDITYLDAVSASDGVTVNTMSNNQYVYVITLGTDVADNVTIDCDFIGG